MSPYARGPVNTCQISMIRKSETNAQPLRDVEDIYILCIAGLRLVEMSFERCNWDRAPDRHHAPSMPGPARKSGDDAIRSNKLAFHYRQTHENRSHDQRTGASRAARRELPRSISSQGFHSGFAAAVALVTPSTTSASRRRTR